MGSRKRLAPSSSNTTMSKSILDAMIDHVPIEIHLPGYHFLGPGTHLEERLSRGDTGRNPLDRACRDHDIAYSQENGGGGGGGGRTYADRRLAERAFSRMLSETADCEEKSAALLTVLCMVGKIAFDRTFRKLKRFKQCIKGMRRKKIRSVDAKRPHGKEA